MSATEIEIPSYGLAEDVGWNDARIRDFVARIAGSETMAASAQEFILEGSFIDFLDVVRAAILAYAPGDLIENTIETGSYEFVAPSLLAHVSADNANHPAATVRARRHLFVLGRRERVLSVMAYVQERFKNERLAMIRWWYRQRKDDLHWQALVIDPPHPVFPEYYPFIEDGPDAYLDRYLNDEASLLFLYGPRGTGKTSFVRHLIYHYHLAASVTYEDALLSMDAMFVAFLTGEDSLLVIEDADTLLQSRQRTANPLVARFLNVTDGLIKFPRKKVIFTTNLGDFSDIDEALTRPGRCFDAINFRSLSEREARAAAEAAGLPLNFREPFTLANLFATAPGGDKLLKQVGYERKK